ncbi:hypothetical protein Rxyl_0303 [Rubrobacter xylanophilus DSM 9941]|uniref:Uncharacterized protein n=1 Tax=Rubrobacter xylanophilus (strain DSM 9941 / JCM 11954 / NBRC 16129 / PRD-1) TaxID=266117 RepID=Q1AZ99_RUBXD|nr:hypothetical protein [Rubrobacter xylanophilus]ABG03279.1 hypothetical protein Rxyl_0303 [Rubrobacter xylanophilus DSM 9941]
MAEGGFRLPGCSYEELVNIIIAYGTRDSAASPGDVGKLNAVHQSSASRTNGFLVEIGVLTGERERLVTRRGRELALALARKDAEGVRRAWRALVSSSEFLQNVVSAVKLREGMLYPTLQAYVAHAAGQPRNKPVMTGAGTVIEILKAAGLLREEAPGQLTAALEDGQGEEPEGPGEPEKRPAEVTLEAGSGPSLSIHLHIRCGAGELDEVVPRLKELLRELQGERVK